MAALAKGFWHAHMGWIFDRDMSNQQRFAPDLLADKDIVRANKYFWVWTIVPVVGPAVVGGLITMSWAGALTASFWAGLVRVALLHHVTWSVNYLCHMIGGGRSPPVTDRPILALALLSFGESWHNLHRADPTSPRHGALRRRWTLGQGDLAPRTIRTGPARSAGPVRSDSPGSGRPRARWSPTARAGDRFPLIDEASAAQSGWVGGVL